MRRERGNFQLDRWSETGWELTGGPTMDITNAQIYKHTTYKYTNTQVHKYTNTQKHKNTKNTKTQIHRRYTDGVK